MSFTPNRADLKALEQFVETVLDAYKTGRADRDSCVGGIAHVMAVAAMDNEAEFKSCIRLPENGYLGE